MSKKKQRIIVAFIMLIVVVVAITGYNYKNNKHRLLICNKYIEQNSAFQMDTYGNLDRHGYYNRNYTGYMPYNHVNQVRLTIVLALYEERTGIHLGLNVIEFYLSDEYDDQGKLAIESIPIKIQDYIDWYVSPQHDNGPDIERYVGGLNDVYREYIYNEDSEEDLPLICECLSLDQIVELIKINQLDEQQIESVITTHDGSQYGIDLSVFGIVRN